MFAGLKRVSAVLFNLIYPDECRLCDQPLQDISRIPVCPTCLSLPKPLEADFFCRACHTPFQNAYPLDERDLCAVCRESLANFDSAYSFGSYEGPLRKLVHLFKYGKIETLAEPLGRFLLQALPIDERFDMVIAMPMHWRKRWERGFNQAELLAQAVTRRYGVKLASNLVRKRYTKPQAGLSEAQRRNNLKDSFFVKDAGQLFNKRVLLVDDVFTTGATLRAAAAALKAVGASSITALTLARVDRPTASAFTISSGESSLLAASAGTGVSY